MPLWRRKRATHLRRFAPFGGEISAIRKLRCAESYVVFVQKISPAMPSPVGEHIERHSKRKRCGNMRGARKREDRVVETEKERKREHCDKRSRCSVSSFFYVVDWGGRVTSTRPGNPEEHRQRATCPTRHTRDKEIARLRGTDRQTCGYCPLITTPLCARIEIALIVASNRVNARARLFQSPRNVSYREVVTAFGLSWFVSTLSTRTFSWRQLRRARW